VKRILALILALTALTGCHSMPAASAVTQEQWEPPITGSSD
jgi:hypothetical protein